MRVAVNAREPIAISRLAACRGLGVRAKASDAARMARNSRSLASSRLASILWRWLTTLDDFRNWLIREAA